MAHVASPSYASAFHAPLHCHLPSTVTWNCVDARKPTCHVPPFGLVSMHVLHAHARQLCFCVKCSFVLCLLLALTAWQCVVRPNAGTAASVTLQFRMPVSHPLSGSTDFESGKWQAYSQIFNNIRDDLATVGRFVSCSFLLHAIWS